MLTTEEIMSIPGLTHPQQLKFLRQEVLNLPDASIIVEIGVWYGRSAFAMADACRGTRKLVYAIDPWSDYAVDDGPLKAQIEALGVTSIEAIYEAFCDKRRALGLEEWLKPIRATSVDALSRWDGGPCSLMFIDGDHHYTAVKNDILSCMKISGRPCVFCGDDWRMDGVRRAVEECIRGGVGLHLQRPCANTWAVRIS